MDCVFYDFFCKGTKKDSHIQMNACLIWNISKKSAQSTEHSFLARGVFAKKTTQISDISFLGSEIQVDKKMNKKTLNIYIIYIKIFVSKILVSRRKLISDI